MFSIVPRIAREGNHANAVFLLRMMHMLCDFSRLLRWTPPLFVCAMLTSCQIPDAGKFSQLHKGMDEAQVITLLGQPSSRTPAQLNKNGQVDVPASWQYGDNLSTFTTSAMFKDQPPSDRVWVVFFGPDGKTAAWQKPSWDQ